LIYYVNKNAQSNADHEVHVSTCAHLPEPANRLYLGDFAVCQPAVEKAKQYYPRSNGCAYCSPACNTG
jgi:hypothetical protein